MYLIKFSYYGPAFESFSEIKGRLTVSGIIKEHISKFCKEYKIKFSSRTDRNVSAISNSFGLICNRDINILMKYLNILKVPIFFHSYAIVDNNFNPRHAKCRKYLYLYEKEIEIDEQINKRIQELIGKKDFSEFSKFDNRNPIRNVMDIKVNKYNGITSFEIIGENFLWNQVRRMVGYIIFGKKNLLMKAENLILKDVCYDFEFKKINLENKNLEKFYLDFLIRQMILEFLKG